MNARRDEAGPAEEAGRRFWTVPNVLCVVRLAGAPGLVATALAEQPQWLLGLFLVLAATDWLDGKLAVWLNQRSAIGPRLDSAADAAMYGGLLFAACWLRWDVLTAEGIWIATAVGAWLASCVLALLKFGRLPTYHTRSAKSAWLLMIPAAVALFLDWSVWPLRIAMLAVTAANCEAMAITILLPDAQSDVPSFRAAWHARDQTAGEQEA